MLYKALIVSVAVSLGLPFHYIMYARINCSNLFAFNLKPNISALNLNNCCRARSLMSWSCWLVDVQFGLV